MMMKVSSLSALVLAAMISLSSGFSPVHVLAPSKTTLWSTTSPEEVENAYHKGGNSRYQAPVIKPARLSDDCEDPFIDLATGDELCWGEAPSHPKNVVASKKPKAAVMAVAAHQVSTADDYHKGGNAHYQAADPPSKLEEECETPFMDFVSGDELCWP